MGEARRRKLRGEYPINELGQATVTAIGAKVIRDDSGRVIGIYQPDDISIRDLEDMARAYLADDPEPFVPARAFTKETRYQRMPDGRVIRIQVDVHPDPRVQRVLHQLREAQLEKALAEPGVPPEARAAIPCCASRTPQEIAVPL